MGDYKKILFSRDHAIKTVTFNRPQAHNALDREMSDELAEAVRAVKRDRDCRFLIFRGAGDTFCAGDDIKDFLTWTEDDPYWQARQISGNRADDRGPDADHHCRRRRGLHRGRP